MAAKGGRRYPLVVFTHMMSRWWTAVFALGLALVGLAWAIRSWGFEQWRWTAFAALGGLIACTGIVIFLIRKSAYAQPFGDYLRVATPFLRMNISYKRFRRTSTASMGALFPPRSVRRSLAEIVEPLAKMTAVVIEVNALPMSQGVLRLFLSPLFFKDKSPHIVILVSDWMRFSAEMDSCRHGGGDVPKAEHRRDISILSKLPKK
ncbi:MAG: hypothetical protein DYG85_14865 [Chloroflexi bacterium CFX1]|nr:hypothetical protein [Chloroflexi bacterium CFX1]MCK6569354.1 hypothetical protein [Anaerolineales bacterium]MCQ3954080.1 hypothetical protein [Chloroflexota bacterium]MDL1920021.1 hypothetical protein [Chloroflexi bacterium CFX5]NUQ59931.1 hypothetical protein [Anaerolineales bacterium]